MEDYTYLKNKIENFSENEFINYIDEYIISIKEEAFIIVVEEIRKRKNIYTENDILNFRNIRKEYRKKEQLNRILENFQKIENINDFVNPLKEIGFDTSEIVEISNETLDQLKKRSEEILKKNRNAIYFLIGGVTLTFMSFSGIFGNGSILFWGAIVYGLYTLIFGDNTSELENTIYLLTKFINENK